MKKTAIFILLFFSTLILAACNNVPGTAPGLDGAAEIDVEVFTAYVEQGLTNAEDLDVTITGTVNTNVLGDYVVNYEVEFNGGLLTFQRTVHVVDTTIPVITLTGGNVTVDVGSTWTDPGYQATDNYDGTITSNVTITGTVNTTTAGTYTLTYNVSDSSGNAAVQKTRTVTVADIDLGDSPVITLTGNATVNYTVGDTYTELGATASDTEDGDISTSIVIDTNNLNMSTAGTYSVTYNVTDSDSNAATQVTRTVIVSAPTNQLPTITLTGGNLTLTVGDTFTEPGYTATDPEDGTITTSVVVGGDTVNTSVAGTYTITYDVTDSAGGVAVQKTRTVTVNAPANQVPVITLTGGDLTLTVGDTFTEPGYTATDPEDGTITTSVVVGGDTVNTSVAGTYTITYDVQDSGGLAATQQTRVVTVNAPANQAPTITLTGGDLTITVGDTYSDPGYSATDPEDGTLTSSVVVAGDTVDPNTTGVYVVTYNVQDSAGLAATEVTRTVTVQPSTQPVGYTALFIQQGATDINWPSILDAFGADNTATITFDTSIIGTSDLVVGSVTIPVTVFTLDNLPTVQAGTIILLESIGEWQTASFELDVTAYVELYVANSSDSFMHTAIQAPNQYEYLLDLVTQNGQLDHTIFIEQGAYLLNIEHYDAATSLSEVRVKVLHTDPTIQLPDEDFTMIYRDELVQESFFDVTTSGDVSFSASSYYPFMIKILDSSDNVIIEREVSMFSYHGYQFTLQQHFASGTYKVVVEFMDVPGRIIQYVNEEMIYDNYFYGYAIDIDISTPNVLQVTPLTGWFAFTIQTDGWYELVHEYALEYMYDFYIYSDDMQYLYYGENLVYLDAGDYYLYFEAYIGEVLFDITLQTGSITTNNNSSTSTPIQFDQEYTAFFDGDNTEKWYTFDVTTEMVAYLFINNDIVYHDAMFTLYFNGDTNEVILDSNEEFYLFEVGTYYLKVEGLSDMVIPFEMTTLSYQEGPIDPLTPDTLTVDSMVSYYLDDHSYHFYTITIGTPGLYSLDLFERGCSAHLLAVDTSDDSVLHDGAIYNGQNYIYLDAGTYELTFSTTFNFGCIYDVQVTDRSSESWTLDTIYNTTMILTDDLIPTIYVESAGVSVYATVTLTEDTLISGWLSNVSELIIYDANDQVIHTGGTYNGLPVPLAAGTYTFELISFYEGLVQIYELEFLPIQDFGDDFANSTVIGDLYGIRGYGSGDYFTDYISFTITETSTYQFTHNTNGDVTFYFLDDEYNQIFSGTWELLYTFEPGDYYLVVVTSGSYYSISAYNAIDATAGDDFSTAKEIYINIENYIYLPDQYHDQYLTFYVPEDTYLYFDDSENTSLFYEIYDSSMSFYYDNFYPQGWYYILLRPTGTYCSGACQPQIITFEFYNINWKVYNNTMSTAVNLDELDDDLQGILMNDGDEFWASFEITVHSAVTFDLDNFNYTSFYLKDSTGTLIQTLNHLPVFLDPGVYYIYVEDILHEFSMFYTSVPYTPVGDTYLTALVVDEHQMFFTDYCNTASDEDWYVVTTTMDHLIYTAYQGTGEMIVYDDPITESIYEQFSSPSYFMLPAGTYYLKAYCNEESKYIIKLDIKDEYIIGDTVAEAVEVSLYDWNPAYALTYGDVDWFFFSITENMSLNIQGDQYMELYTDTDLVNEVTDYNLTPGLYYLKRSAPYSGYYSFQLYPGQEAVQTGLINNDSTTPEVLTVASTAPYFTLYDTCAGWESNQDWFEVTLTSDMIFGVQNHAYGKQLYIYSPTVNDQIDSFYASTEQVVFELTAGTYYFMVNGCYNEYNIVFGDPVYTDYSDTFSSATSVSTYDRVTSYLMGTSDQDWFEFIVPFDTIIKLEGNARFDLYQDEITLITDNIAFEYIPITAGTYYLKVTPFVDEVIDYYMAIYDYHHYMVSTTMTTAKDIPVYDFVYKVDGFVEANTPSYFTFTLPQTSTLEFDCSVSMRILDSLGTEVFGPSYPAGVYYLELSETYDTTFTCLYRQTHNLSYTEVSNEPLTLYRWKFAYSDNGSSPDNFTYTTGPSSEIVYLEFGGYDSPSIVIKDSSANVLYDLQLSTDNLEYYPFELPANDTYDIYIGNMNGDYQFRLRDDFTYDAPNSIDYAQGEEDNQLTITETRTFVLYDPSDEDWLWFEFYSDESPMVIQTTGISVTVEVYDYWGTLVTDLTSVNADTYYIRVTSTTSGVYGITVYDYDPS